MNKPHYISLKEFHYPLDEKRIAGFPLEKRDESSLLVFRDGRKTSSRFKNLADFLEPGSHLVFNETKVIHARLKFRKETGSAIEIFCLEPAEPGDYQLNFSSRECVSWKCLVGNLKKWKSGELILEKNKGLKLTAKINPAKSDSIIIDFRWNDSSLSFSEIIETFGSTPIPPYLNREAVDSDSLNYQTVYSRNEGSVAAPTAGLHFTPHLLSVLKEKGFGRSFLNLHVGAGTFVPVKSENAAEHRMHIERMVVSREFLASVASDNHRIVSVGTTSCRSLESLYWTGVKILEGRFDPENPDLGQWEAYKLNGKYSRQEAFDALLSRLGETGQETLSLSTGIMIAPGYDFRMTDALVTNFHQPSSTLLMLVAALVGDSWKDIYDYALSHNYRFLSYGDSSLLFPFKK